MLLYLVHYMHSLTVNAVNGKILISPVCWPLEQIKILYS